MNYLVSVVLNPLSLHDALPIYFAEAGRDPQWYLNTTAYLIDKLEHAGVEDHVDNHGRSAADVAAEVLWVTGRSEEHTSELQSPDHLVCRLLLEKKKVQNQSHYV